MITNSCSLLFILLFISIIYIVNQNNNNNNNNIFEGGKNNNNNINEDLRYLLEKTNYGKFTNLEEDVSTDKLQYNFIILFKNNNGNYFNLFDKYDKSKSNKIISYIKTTDKVFNTTIQEGIETQISNELNTSVLDFSPSPSKFIAGNSSIGLHYDFNVSVPKDLSIEQFDIKLNKFIENNLIRTIHSNLFEKYVTPSFQKISSTNNMLQFSLKYKLNNIDLANLENMYRINSLDIMKNTEPCPASAYTLCKRDTVFTYYDAGGAVTTLNSPKDKYLFYSINDGVPTKFYKINNDKLEQINMLFNTSIR